MTDGRREDKPSRDYICQLRKAIWVLNAVFSGKGTSLLCCIFDQAVFLLKLYAV
jgi:hypothetical protein